MTATTTRSRHIQRESAGLPPTICVASGKGGVGKTSIALSLAREISKVATVLVLDLDYFNRGSTGLLNDCINVDRTGTSILDFLANAQANVDAAEPSSKDLWVVPIDSEDSFLFCPCPDLSRAVTRALEDLSTNELSLRLRQAIAQIHRTLPVDCVVIDAHGGPDTLSIAACTVSEHTLLVTEPDKVTLYGTLNFLSRLRSESKLPHGSGKTHLLFNRVSGHFSWRGLSRLYDTELSDLFDGPLAGMLPFEEEIFKHFGNSPFITDLFPKSVFARKIKWVLRNLLLDRSSDLIPEEIRRWPARRARRVSCLLHDKSWARPLPIAVLWAIAFGALFLSSSAAALDPLGLKSTADWALTLSFPIGAITAVMALINSLKLAIGATSKSLRFARNTPFARLYAVKVGINMSLVVAISAMVLGGPIAILLPSISNAREQARRAICSSNLRIIVISMKIYANDFGEAYPPDFEMLVKLGEVMEKQFLCPSSDAELGDFYACFQYIDGQGEWDDSRNVLVYEKPECHAGEGGNVAFVDGHVDFLPPSEIIRAVSDTYERLGTEKPLR